jgi:hypothetical protein
MKPMVRRGDIKFVIMLAIVVLPGPSQGADRPGPRFLSPAQRDSVLSPDGKWLLTVWGDKGEVPWLMLESVGAGLRVRAQVWPLTQGAFVLWRPDSKAFAFADARWEDHYFLFVDQQAGYTGSEVVDISATIEKHFSKFAGGHLQSIRWLVKPLLWGPSGLLLVGVKCVTEAAATSDLPGCYPNTASISARRSGNLLPPDLARLLLCRARPASTVTTTSGALPSRTAAPSGTRPSISIP